MTSDFFESGIIGYEERLLSPLDRRYLRDFWLNGDTLIKEWSDVLEGCFVIRGNDVSISPAKNVDVQVGGMLFTEEEFSDFKRHALRAGARNFIVIEDVAQQDWSQLPNRSFFRFRYPLSISWETIANSCSIANDVFLRPIRAYFVVVDNGQLGKYSNNDAIRPYELFFMNKSSAES